MKKKDREPSFIEKLDRESAILKIAFERINNNLTTFFREYSDLLEKTKELKEENDKLKKKNKAYRKYLKPLDDM